MLLLFATMLTGPRINTGVVTPSGGLFLTCRGEKYIHYCTIIYSVQYLHVRFPNAKNPLLWVAAFSVRVQTSLHSGPMLNMVCPISHKPLAPTIPQARPFQSHMSTHVHSLPTPPPERTCLDHISASPNLAGHNTTVCILYTVHCTAVL
jgi:hypothetical protein